MTTSPIVSITDELVAELEQLANECGQHGSNWYEPRHMAAFPEYACDQDFVVAASPATILALLAEREELKRDADRYRWLRDSCDNDPANLGIEYAEIPGVDAAIEAARSSAT